MNQPAVLYTSYPPTAAVTATDSYAGADPADVLFATEDTFWRPANQTGDKTLTVDFGADRTVDRLGIVGENLDGCLVDVRVSSDNFIASNVLLADGVTLAAAVNAATVPFVSSTYRYARLVFKAGYYPSNLRLAWLCWDRQRVLPYLEEDFDPDNLDATGEHLVSRQGLYLGSEQERTMRRCSLNLGQVTDFEYAIIKEWAAACIGTLQPFLFVPDIDEAAALFAWPADNRFSAPRVNGLRRVAPMMIVTRGA